AAPSGLKSNSHWLALSPEGALVNSPGRQPWADLGAESALLLRLAEEPRIDDIDHGAHRACTRVPDFNRQRLRPGQRHLDARRGLAPLQAVFRLHLAVHQDDALRLAALPLVVVQADQGLETGAALDRVFDPRVRPQAHATGPGRTAHAQVAA